MSSKHHKHLRIASQSHRQYPLAPPPPNLQPMGHSPPLPTPPVEQLFDYTSLCKALAHLASLLLRYFGNNQVTLYVHGGAVMVLHKELNGRRTTRDVDVCLREFNQEWARKGIHNAEQILRGCILETARAGGLAEDWMNSGPDVALPKAKRPDGSEYDPVVHAAKNAGNLVENIIYNSSPLRLVAVSWQWAVSLKLVRYKKNDPYDIACILFYAMQKGTAWSRPVLEAWIRKSCSAMGYHRYTPEMLEKLRGDMRHAIQLAYQRGGMAPPPSALVPMPPSLKAVADTFQAPPLAPSHSHHTVVSFPMGHGHGSHPSRPNQVSVF